VGNSSLRPQRGLIRKELRPSQSEAVHLFAASVAVGCNGFAFIHEQRVGKTLPALACVVETEVPRLLIICLKKGISVWQKEINESLPPDWGVEVQMFHFQQLLNKKLFNRLKRWCAKTSTFMIVDEAHHIKRRGSKWSKRCRSLGKKCAYRLALTGTLIAQGIQDAWAVFDYLDPRIFGKWALTKREVNPETGRRVIRVVGGFQHRFLLMDPFWKSKVVGYQNEEEFQRIFHQHTYRITLKEAQIQAGQRPTIRKRRVLTCKLLPPAQTHYDELEEQLITVVNRKRVETPLQITLTMKLQQICGGYLIDEDSVAHELGSRAKLGLLRRALDCVVMSSMSVELQPVVVVCRFLHEIPRIRRVLQTHGYKTLVIKGGVEFDASVPITASAVILQIQSGVSIDLSFAEYLIFYSWDYSHINHEQTKFRVLKFNSRRVAYYYLVMKHTIDELILQAVLRKKNLATLVCDHYRRSKRE
jgi:SNF2-related domain